VHRLILFRHGKSAWPEGVSDHERPLAPRGVEAVPLMSRWLVENALTPDLALVSTARRTRMTFELIAEVMPGLNARLEQRIYEASVKRLLAALADIPASLGTLLMVGHNPGMQELALQLSGTPACDLDARSRLKRKYPTSGVAVLETVRSWAELAPGQATLRRFQTPAMLGGIDED
jgi:phosphohistidine phosphatase